MLNLKVASAHTRWQHAEGVEGEGGEHVMAVEGGYGKAGVAWRDILNRFSLWLV